MNAIILAHGGAAETVARHTPNWESAFDGLIFISPGDAPLPGSLTIGQSCRNGVGSIERLLFAVSIASRFPTCAILEYDCLVFPKITEQIIGSLTAPGLWPVPDYGMRALWPWPPKDTILCSQTFPNQDPPDIFAAPTYGHAPWIATGETWWKLLLAGSDYQHGFPDRWLANAASRANVALLGMDGAYSRDAGFDAKAARIARLAGAPCIHGIKTAEEFATVMLPSVPDIEAMLWRDFAQRETERVDRLIMGEDDQEQDYARTSCPACNGTGCDRCIPQEFEDPE